MLVAWLLAVAVAGAAADSNVVGLMSGVSGYNQIITSSTLRWLTPDNGKVPDNAVQAAEERVNQDDEEVVRKMWVCRARAAQSNNMWLAGVLTMDNNGNGKCVASKHGIVQPYTNYEVLQNFEDGGRLTWVKWDKLHTPPSGSVTIGTEPLTFVARRKSEDPTSTVNYHLGRIEKGLMGKIIVIEEGTEKIYYDGEVLVETEPIKYELTNVKFYPTRGRPRLQREPMILGSTVMRNEDEPTDDGSSDEVNRVDTVIAYNTNQTVNWGQGHAILAGLPVTALHPNGTVMDEFKWATDTFITQSPTYQVEAFLAKGRGVNVTLVGNWTEANIPYTAKLNTVYPDGVKKQRTISGSKREVGLRDVHPEYGPVYYLHNNTHVPTTTTTTTTTTTSRSTSTSATTSRTTSTSTEEAKPIPASPMEEMNSTTKKGDLADPGKKRENWPHDEPKSEPSEGSGTSDGLGVRAGPVLLLGFLVLRLFT